MLQNTPNPRVQVIATLSKFRQEWQEATGRASLIEVEGNMGMLLADLINGLGLGATEQIQVLGGELYQEMQDFLQSPNRI